MEHVHSCLHKETFVVSAHSLCAHIWLPVMHYYVMKILYSNAVLFTQYVCTSPGETLLFTSRHRQMDSKSLCCHFERSMLLCRMTSHPANANSRFTTSHLGPGSTVMIKKKRILSCNLDTVCNVWSKFLFKPN